MADTESPDEPSGRDDAPAHDGLDGSWQNLRMVALVLGLLVGIGVVTIVTKMGTHAGSSLILGLACLTVGALVGFLFGIPRVEQLAPPPAGDPNKPRPATALEAAAADAYRQRVNTNLEQISDWLTKIIVGLGLIELRNVPGYLQSVAAYQADGADQSPAFAASLVVYFALLGFFSGYLLTRLFLSPAFALADQFEDLRRLLRKVAGQVRINRKAIVEGVGKKGAAAPSPTFPPPPPPPPPPSAPPRPPVEPVVPSAGEPPVGGPESVPPAALPPVARHEPPVPDEDPDDNQKGRWGGLPERNGRRLSARVRPTDDEDLFEVLLQVTSTDPQRPLTRTVTFHLHRTFKIPETTVRVRKGVARTSVLAYGAFTVGAEADDGQTQLELDLSTLEDAPKLFRQR
jgi:hypothetical protein